MMRWNKTKLAAALVCGIALVGVGSGWLARGHNAALAAKKEPLPQKAPDSADKIKSAIKKIHAEMDYLADEEAGREAKLAEEAIEARLNLMAMQDALRLQERERELQREQDQDRLKAAARELAYRERIIDDFKKNMDRKSESYKERMDKVVNLKESAAKKLDEERRSLLLRDKAHNDTLRGSRKRVFKAESDLRSIEARQERQRAEFAERRHALFARELQLKSNKLDLEPADRLRDMERKLDSLRREVGELRRALERQKSE